MQTRRIIALLTLASFLPLAAGCSPETTVAIQTDPGSNAETPNLDEPVSISGYTTRHGGFRHWRGTVQNSPPDGLLFVDQNYSIEYRSSQRAQFRLAREDVVSIQMRSPKEGQTTLLVMGALAGLLFVLVAVATSIHGKFN